MPVKGEEDERGGTGKRRREKTMAGLSVLLEGRKDMASPSAKIIMKNFVTRSLSSPPVPSNSGFLKSCYLCGKQLSLENDIYMYR